MGSKQRFLTYEYAKKYVQEHNIRSRAHYWKWYDETKPPLPKYPNRAWPDKWESWNVFLNNTNGFEKYRAEKIGKKLNYLPFYEAMAVVQKIAKQHNITTKEQYLEAKAKKLIPDNIPNYPESVYTEWKHLEKGWPTWLGITLEGKIKSVKNVERLLAVVQVAGCPPNVVIPVVASLNELREKANKQEIGSVYKLFTYDERQAQIIEPLFERFGHKQPDGGFIVPNVNALLWSIGEYFDFYIAR